MKSSLTATKKAMFLMATILVVNAQAKMEMDNIEFLNKVGHQPDDVVSITVTTEVVTQNPESDTQEKKTTETYIAVEENQFLVEETETVEPVVIHAENVEELAEMINKGEVRTFKQLIAACKNFPELIEVAYKFMEERISTNTMAFAKFKTLKNQTAKKLIFTLVMKVKDKEKLWNLFRD